MFGDVARDVSVLLLQGIISQPESQRASAQSLEELGFSRITAESHKDVWRFYCPLFSHGLFSPNTCIVFACM